MMQFIVTVGYFVIMFLHICLQEMQHVVDKKAEHFNFRAAAAKSVIWPWYLGAMVFNQVAPIIKEAWSEEKE